MTIQGHPRSLILAQIASTYETSYLSSIVTVVNLGPIMVIRYYRGFVCRKHWSRSAMLGFAESKNPRLTCKIIFEEFQPM